MHLFSVSKRRRLMQYLFHTSLFIRMDRHRGMTKLKVKLFQTLRTPENDKNNVLTNQSTAQWL